MRRRQQVGMPYVEKLMKRAKISVGDLFAVPRSDGKFVLGQIVDEWMQGVVCIALFDVVLDSLEVDSTALARPEPFVLLSVASAELTKGYWKVVGHSRLMVDASLGPHQQFSSSNYIGASWHSGGKVEDLVNAFYGLATWEPYPGRPGHLRSLLLRQLQ